MNQPEPSPAMTEPAPASSAPPEAPRGSFGSWLVSALGLCGLGAALFFFGVLPRLSGQKELEKEQQINGQRTVIFGLAQAGSATKVLPLPGTLQAFQEASLYARTSGYVKRWNVDIGQRVKEGDLLAELDTPEVDQQLLQARAQAEQSGASLAIAELTAKRYNEMIAQRAVSQEDADEKNSARDVAKANHDANQADVQRLVELQNFKQIRAPFDGVVTARNIEIGNLVSSGTGNIGLALFRVAQVDVLRLFIDVPEIEAPSVHAGVKAELRVQSRPDRVFTGQVVRTAGALDNASRTLRTEIQVANGDGALLAGSYAQVKLSLENERPSILIPANGLLVNAAGTSVVLVVNENGQDRLKFLSVRVGRDLGTEVEILGGVQAGDRVVANPATDLADRMVVIAKPISKGSSGGSAPPPGPGGTKS